MGKLKNMKRAYPYRLMEVQLEHVKDLGILINTELTLDVRVSEKIKNDNNMLVIYLSCMNADILLPL